jgi:hypothetical protein
LGGYASARVDGAALARVRGPARRKARIVL